MFHTSYFDHFGSILGSKINQFGGTIKKIVSARGGYIRSACAWGGAVFLTASRHYLLEVNSHRKTKALDEIGQTLVPGA